MKLVRASAEPTLIRAGYRTSFKTGSQDNQVRMHRRQFSSQGCASGSGFRLRRDGDAYCFHNPGEIVAEVKVAAGRGDWQARRGFPAVGAAEGGIAVYDHMDYIKVTPEDGARRIWAAMCIPKGYQQFEAIGYQRGADGKPHTADDVELGPWTLRGQWRSSRPSTATMTRSFVGTLSPTALFTPALDGPNPERKFSRNNYGDVWVVATSKNRKGKGRA